MKRTWLAPLIWPYLRGWTLLSLSPFFSPTWWTAPALVSTENNSLLFVNSYFIDIVRALRCNQSGWWYCCLYVKCLSRDDELISCWHIIGRLFHGPLPLRRPDHLLHPGYYPQGSRSWISPHATAASKASFMIYNRQIWKEISSLLLNY